jgi:hypothetical protein
VRELIFDGGRLVVFIGFNGKLHFADDIIVKLEYQRDVMSIQLQAVLDLQETDPILRMG